LPFPGRCLAARRHDYLVLPHDQSAHPESENIDRKVQYCTRNGIPFRALRDGDVIIEGGKTSTTCCAGPRRTPRHIDEVSMSPKKATQKPAKGTAATGKKSTGFTDDERAAMKDRAEELKAEARRGPRAKTADGESDVLAKIAEMPDPDRTMATRLHALIKASAPALSPKTWYGMPAYARDGKVICFFQSAQKFKSRYATFGFSDAANLDEGAMWPTSFALKELTAADEARIIALVKKAVSQGRPQDIGLA